ncbi:helix-turn-helix domain-containing protein [Mycobacterium asiaticum]|uniref:helix-turn-helix domain-containing protein n=1 Tax=Mycobacterium asiaticum TaxID=1790 RepID=UPI0031405FF2
MTGPLTYDLAEAAERIGGVSEKWLAAQLRAGKLPGRKVGRKWRMTIGDIETAVEIFRVTPHEVSPVRGPQEDSLNSGLTRNSRRRFAS